MRRLKKVHVSFGYIGQNPCECHKCLADWSGNQSIRRGYPKVLACVLNTNTQKRFRWWKMLTGWLVLLGIFHYRGWHGNSIRVSKWSKECKGELWQIIWASLESLNMDFGKTFDKSVKQMVSGLTLSTSSGRENV